MKKPVKIRRQFWRLHRRIGLLSVVVLVVLCVTGIILNHSAHWHVDRLKVSSPLILKAYGVDIPEFKGAKVESHWLVQIASELYLDGRVLAQCQGELIGVWNPPNTDYWAAACQRELILFTHDNELIEAIDNNLGLPMPIIALGACDANLCLQVDEGLLNSNNNLVQTIVTYRIDLESLEWLPSPSQTFNALTLAILPKDQQNYYRPFYTGQDITWERVVLDIHAGRFLGAAGPWVLDVFVLMFLFLSGSGFYLWYSARKK